MAEVQKNTESGETAQKFIEFVMMQAQTAMFYLGQIPNPQTGKPMEPNLEVAKMCIDQLAMIREKTRGNLNGDETAVLNNAVSNLQMAYVEISQGLGVAPAEAVSDAPAKEEELPPAAAQDPASSTDESKKKFSKSYGS